MTDKPSVIQFYGTTWCYSSRRARATLDEYKIPYVFIDIDVDMDGRRYVEQVNNGNRSVPTILFTDGSLLVEPSIQQLKEKLGLA